MLSREVNSQRDNWMPSNNLLLSFIGWAPNVLSFLSFSFTGRPLIARRPVKEKERLTSGESKGVIG